jgi:hypothetical protein
MVRPSLFGVSAIVALVVVALTAPSSIAYHVPPRNCGRPLHPSSPLRRSSSSSSSSSSSHPPSRAAAAATPLRMTSDGTDDRVARLLAKARALREEAALLSGKTIEEMEDERRREKAIEKERLENAANASRGTGETRDARYGASRAGGGGGTIPPVPEDAASQVRQAASAIERAYADGIVRQTVRFALLSENEGMSDEINEWPGGSRQMYREAGRPLSEMLLREVRAYAAPPTEVDAPTTTSTNGNDVDDDDDDDGGGRGSIRTPPSIEARDILDFDGSAVITARAALGPHGNVNAVVFPNTDLRYLKDIETLSANVGPHRLLLLVNPFWKDVESWGYNILAPNGKGRAREVIFDVGYDVTYAILRFSARGEDCLALKSYPHDWQLYAYREDPSWYNRKVPIWLGSSIDEPSYARFSELLNGRPEFKMNKNMRQMQRMMGNDDQ